jgi:PmbA protein
MDLDLFHPWDISGRGRDRHRAPLRAGGLRCQPHDQELGRRQRFGAESHFVSANSLGFMGGFATSRHYVSCSVIAGEGEDMQRDDWYASRNAMRRNFPMPRRIGDYAARRALSRLGARKLKTRKCPVIFEAPLATGLIGSFVHAISGGALYRKTSFLVDSLGKQMFPDFVQISERPHIRGGFASSPFDDDGVATHDREVVKDGVLQGYFLSTYSGAQAGHADHGQCRRRAQPAGAVRHAMTSRAAARNG